MRKEHGVRVEIWADVVCPWCYVGKRRFEVALQAFEHRDEVEVVWRSFELDPATVSDTEAERGDNVARLAEKYSLSLADARAAIARTTQAAAAEGLELALDRARTSRTFDAHRLVHLAAEHGLAEQVEERLMHAHFSEGASVADRDTLLRLVAEVGVDASAAADVLDSDAFADAVRADEAEAAALGIGGVPFFVLDRSYGVSGAQPSEHLLSALHQAWAARLPV